MSCFSLLNSGVHSSISLFQHSWLGQKVILGTSFCADLETPHFVEEIYTGIFLAQQLCTHSANIGAVEKY